MPIVAADAAGRQQAGRVLDAGGAVIVPLPTPLPYVVASLDAAMVNVAKGRPSEQPVGLTVADFSLVTPHVELDADTLALARWLTADQLLNLLLPVGDGRPAWMRPSTSKGWLGVTLACLDQTRALLDQRRQLYLSSANRTGYPPALTAPAADAAFAGQLLVINGDPARALSVAAGSATIVRVGSHRHLEVIRHGIHDAAFAGDTQRFLQHLIRRWEHTRH
jgi:L-threonylcarbamoyladenylate synthase